MTPDIVCGIISSLSMHPKGKKVPKMKKKALTVVLGVVAALALVAVIGFAVLVRMASDASARRPAEVSTPIATTARSGAIPLAQLATQIPTAGTGTTCETNTPQCTSDSPPAATGRLYYPEAAGGDDHDFDVAVDTRVRCYWEAPSGTTIRFNLMGPDISIDPTLAVRWVESTKLPDHKVKPEEAVKGFNVSSTGQIVYGQITVLLRRETQPHTGGLVELKIKEADTWRILDQIMVFAK